jgi:P-type Mg2+ transporter
VVGDRGQFARTQLLVALSVVLVGAVLPFTPLAHVLGFQPLPGLFFLTLAGLVLAYLALVEAGKHWFYRLHRAPATPAPRCRTPGHRIHRRAARFTIHTRLPARRRNAGKAPGEAPHAGSVPPRVSRSAS